MNEQKFMRMAISEGGTPINGDYTPENRAEHHLSHGIDMLVWNKKEFLAAGVCFLDGFEASVLESIQNEKDGNADSELIDAFRVLIHQSKQIDRAIFLNLLDNDWDLRLEAE